MGLKPKATSGVCGAFRIACISLECESEYLPGLSQRSGANMKAPILGRELKLNCFDLPDVEEISGVPLVKTNYFEVHGTYYQL